MRWFKRKLRNWLQDSEGSLSVVQQTEPVQAEGMRISIYNAVEGGWVIEYRSYDRKTDRNNNRLYIINCEENLGERLGHIISIEALRN